MIHHSSKLLWAVSFVMAVVACENASRPKPPMVQEPSAPPNASRTVEDPAQSPDSAVNAAGKIAVEDHDWTLVSSVDAQGKASSAWVVPSRPAISIHFDGRKLMVQNLCNVISADYSVTGKQLKIGSPSATELACQSDILDVEGRVLRLLPTAEAIDLQAGKPPRLTIRWADGRKWELSAKSTP